MDSLSPDPILEGAPGRPGSWVRDLLPTVAVVTAVSLPVFLVGILAEQLRPALHFDAAVQGLVIGIGYAGSAIFSYPGGAAAERLGGIRLLRFSAGLTAASALAVALWVHSWPALAVALFFAGVASSTAQPASNLLVARRMARTNQGLAFGIKQAAVPLAFLLGGAAVPAVALTVGWRWVFVGAAGLAVAAGLVVPRPRQGLAARLAQHRRGAPREPALPLAVFALGFFLALCSCASLGAFLVTAAVSGGIGKAEAGVVAVVASAAAVAVRVLTGLQADHRGSRHFRHVAAMQVVGAVGFLTLAAAATLHQTWLLWAGAVVAYGIGWGWNGLFNYAIVNSHRLAPGRATGITQTGGRLGSVIGPLTFGLLVVHIGYGGAWLAPVGEALAAAALMLLGQRLLTRRDQPMTTSPAP